MILSCYSMLIGNGKVLRLYSDTHTALPLLAWAGHSHFPVFLHYERRKTSSCSFTEAIIGSKLDFPVFLRSKRRKTRNCSYAAGTCGKIFQSDFLSFFPFFRLLLGHGPSLVPQNEGWTCVNNNWVRQSQITIKT